MIGAGWAALVPALLTMGLTVVGTVIVVRLWSHELDVLADAIRRIAMDGSSQPNPGTPHMARLKGLGVELDRLSRRVANRTALVERLQRADGAIVERLPDPLIILGNDRSVRRANAAARAAFGPDIAAVLRHPGLRGAIDRAFTSGDMQSAELTLPVPVAREVQAAVVPMDPPPADGGQAMLVLSDRTRERAVERMRADFVANASHELRTPLASLIGFIETLRGPAADDPPAQQRFLTIMTEQGERMNRLIDDLLSLSRIELIEHQAPSEALDLGELIPRVVAGMEPRLSENQARLDMVLAARVPRVRGDADQIAQVLHNLLDNAIKYGRPGGTIRLTAEGAAGEKWPARPGIVLAVADQGTGIAREHLPRLTERFYRVDKTRSRAVGGTGLGLAIVKHIVNRHRGQLVIESEEGVGTTVSIWLPQATPVPATDSAHVAAKV